jgi:hypothetical protein
VRSDVAESEHARSIRNDRNEIRLVGVGEDLLGMRSDIAARRRDSGRIPNGEVLTTFDRAFRRNFKFTAIKRV